MTLWMRSSLKEQPQACWHGNNVGDYEFVGVCFDHSPRQERHLLDCFLSLSPGCYFHVATENVTGIPLDLKDINCGDSGAMTVFLQGTL